MATYKIPEGWKAEVPKSVPDRLVLEVPGDGWITICFVARAFTPGYTLGGLVPARGEHPYNGRGWRQRLVDDAVAHLKQTLEIA